MKNNNQKTEQKIEYVVSEDSLKIINCPKCPIDGKIDCNLCYGKGFIVVVKPEYYVNKLDIFTVVSHGKQGI